MPSRPDVVSLGVVEIHQQQIELPAGDGGQRRLRRRDRLHGHAFSLQQQAERVEQVGLIVGNEDAVAERRRRA